MFIIMKSKNIHSIENEFIRLEFIKPSISVEDDNVAIEYYVREKKERRHILTHRSNSVAEIKINPSTLFKLTDNSEILIPQYKIKDIIKEESSTKINLTATNFKTKKMSNKKPSISNKNYAYLNTLITFPDNAKFIHIENKCEFIKPLEVEYFISPYIYPFNADFCWSPNLLFHKDNIVGEHCFRSPTIILQKDTYMVGLIPDLKLFFLKDKRLHIRRGMEINVNYMNSNGKFSQSKRITQLVAYFSYGFINHKSVGHVYYKKVKKGIKIHKNSLTYGYYLYFTADAEKKAGYQEIVRLIWGLFGEESFRKEKVQVVDFDTYAKYGYEYLKRNKWMIKEFEISDGDMHYSATPTFPKSGTGISVSDSCPRNLCAGIYALVFTSKKVPKIMSENETYNFQRLEKLGTLIHKLVAEKMTNSPFFSDLMEFSIHNFQQKVVPQIMNQEWFNNFRSAYGMYWFGKKWGDDELVSLAVKIKNLVLASPEEDGAFCSVCFCPDEPSETAFRQREKTKIIWRKGTKAFEHVDFYHTADCSATAYWMLNWYQDLEQDVELLSKTIRYANFLLKIQLPSGAFPAWVKTYGFGKKIKAHKDLKESATTSCSGRFLTKLYKLLTSMGNDNKIKIKEKIINNFLEASKKAGEYLINSVFPENKWWDYETFFSCSKKAIGLKDKYTGLYPQNTLSLYWTAEHFRLLYEVSGNEFYLIWGKKALDLLCLYQQVWNAPFLSINTFGGFGVMNTDAEWNDSRQSLFALTLLDYYHLTKEEEYLQRGIAALCSAFTLMLIPENKDVAAGNMTTVRERDYGATYENYGHLAYDRRVPGYVQFDWGTGNACTAIAAIQATKKLNI